MATVTKFTVVPKLPADLEDLRTLAHNFSWCWNPEAVALFFRMDPDLWISVNQNPVRMLGALSQERLQELAADESYLAHLDRVRTEFQSYVGANTWAERHPDAPEEFQVAYLSLEFGIHESLSIYSGGLGLLAGDHLKSASDLGMPLVGVGLLYREGYHSQYLNADGWQQERYPRNDFYNMAVKQVKGEDGKPLIIEVDYPERTVYARVWVVNVGRVPLYLMDCDFEANEAADRGMTARLYGGDPDMRIRQEILLGMGGVQLLHALGIWPSVFHMNEGHSAFMTLERIRWLVQNEKISFQHAAEAVKSGSVFTTHTPVPAGNDMFNPDMIGYYFKKYCEEVGISMEHLLALGRQDPKDSREPFCMTVLALRLSAATNGVSRLHGDVARDMWARIWQGLPTKEVPITHITNGVHPRFWVSRDMGGLFDRYIGPSWLDNPADPQTWQGIDLVPDPELWRTHERRRERLVNFARRRLTRQLQDRDAPHTQIDAAAEALDPEVLTIGFARRFATYKRGNLFLMDRDRMARILSNSQMPVQFIIAGKAHPADNQAKELIRNLIHFIRDYELRARMVFIEDYDINVARYMVQGVDCWLNTPRRPLEASGTSGMKVALNGGLNISIPDGWWCEAIELGENGWAIGRGETYDSPEEQDQVESQMLYELLEREIVPRFYDRGRDGVPRRWVQMMKTAIRTISPVFNTHRMVMDYNEKFYMPCTQRRKDFGGKGRPKALALAKWKQKVEGAWSKVKVTNVQSGLTEGLPFGGELPVSAVVNLAGLTAEDVKVEVFYGPLDPYGKIIEGQSLCMEPQEEEGEGVTFRGAIECDRTGQLGFSVRVIPSHPDLANKFELPLVAWN